MAWYTYTTAATANGFLATPDDRLDWLFAVDAPHPESAELLDRTTVIVLGSTTYEWLLRQPSMADARAWKTAFGTRSVFVFTHRQLLVAPGINLEFLSGPVANHAARLTAEADGGTVWVQGGGDLAGQFYDCGLLDEIVVHIAPVFLATGRELLPRTIPADRLQLTQVTQTGQFVTVAYRVVAAA